MKQFLYTLKLYEKGKSSPVTTKTYTTEEDFSGGVAYYTENYTSLNLVRMDAEVSTGGKFRTTSRVYFPIISADALKSRLLKVMESSV